MMGYLSFRITSFRMTTDSNKRDEVSLNVLSIVILKEKELWFSFKRNSTANF